MSNHRSARSLLLSIAGLCLLLAASAAPGQPTLTEYTVESAFVGNGTKGITVGPDGQVWFVNPNAAHAVGKITTGGQISYLPNPVFDPAKAPTVQTATGPITSVNDGDAWMGYGQTLVQRMLGGLAGSQVINHYFPDAQPSLSSPYHQMDGIAWDGATTIWFTEMVNGQSLLGKYDFSASAPQDGVPMPTECRSFSSTGRDMTRAPDGSLWFPSNSYACRIQPGGTVSSVHLPLFTSDGIAYSSSDGRIWVTAYTGSAHLQAFDPATCHDATCVTVYDLSSPAHHLHGLASGPDGRIWFTSENPDLVGSVKADGSDLQSILLKDSLGNSPTTSKQPAQIVAGPPGDNSVWFTEHIANKIGRVTGLTVAPATTLFLQGGRFKIEVAWAVPPQGTSGQGNAVPIAPDTGAFWFLGPANLELMVKVLDGRAINGHWWVFYGAITNVEYTLTITDTSDGAVQTYHNPYGTLGSNADTLAFTALYSPPPQESRSSQGETRAVFTDFDPADLVRAELSTPAVVSGEEVQTACTPDATSLCLNAARFKVQVAWRAPSQGTSGVGTAAALTSDTGDFWFFSANNLELIIKVLDGRGINNHFWVFYGALSNVEYTITVTDTQTGAVKTYVNPSGNLASVADVLAF